MTVRDLLSTLQRLVDEQEECYVEDYGVYFSDTVGYGMKAVTDVSLDHNLHECILQRKV
jgi:hypothetical protein